MAPKTLPGGLQVGACWGHVGDSWPLRREHIGRFIFGCSWDAFGVDFSWIFGSSWKARSSQKYCFYSSFGTFSGFPDNSTWKASWSYLGTVLPPKTPQVEAKLEPSWEENRSGEALGEDLTRRSTKDGKQEGQEDEKYRQEAQDRPNMSENPTGTGHGGGIAVASGEVRRGTLRTRNTWRIWQELGKGSRTRPANLDKQGGGGSSYCLRSPATVPGSSDTYGSSWFIMLPYDSYGSSWFT